MEGKKKDYKSINYFIYYFELILLILIHWNKDEIILKYMKF